MENNIILYGASGHCKVVIDILLESSVFIKGILDDNIYLKQIFNFPVFNPSDHRFNTCDKYLISIGDNRIRKEIVFKLFVEYTSAIHPKSTVSRFSEIGVGTVVMAGVIVNPDVKIGKHCIINTAASIDHDCVIEDFSHISPNASLAGNVFVGEGSQVGIGATIMQGIKIGKWVTIGAGAVVINDVPDYAVVVGNPGKVIKYNSNE
ncbi:acetyltransferase [Flavobacterium terrae]|uniref:Acetyltransferase EpsM n=1 Tax=Flavobacterium terrae TaxID=415425 RepID=A0A1M6FSH1_9FLAO|nr:acetyltransferase [Flavobacterium terrae]SHJ00655.1 acetyltransferase EpsM [Flavobacterium terrae]